MVHYFGGSFYTEEVFVNTKIDVDIVRAVCYVADVDRGSAPCRLSILLLVILRSG